MRPCNLTVRSIQPCRHLRGYWDEVIAAAASICLDNLEAAAVLLEECHASRGTVYIVGNGGSAATASHLACDLLKGTRGDGPPTFRAVALTDNVPLITAWANDVAYDRVFAEQFASLARPNDVLVAISASGNSSNIVAVAEAAQRSGVPSIGLTGRTGGRLAGMVDLPVYVPSDRIEIVEDAHLIACHSLCVALRERLRTPQRHPARQPAPDGLASIAAEPVVAQRRGPVPHRRRAS